jgi:hypothetical protein
VKFSFRLQSNESFVSFAIPVNFRRFKFGKRRNVTFVEIGPRGVSRPVVKYSQSTHSEFFFNTTLIDRIVHILDMVLI